MNGPPVSGIDCGDLPAGGIVSYIEGMGTELYEDSAAPCSPERSSAGLLVLLLVALAVGGWIGWEYYENYQASCRARAEAEEADIAASESLAYILRMQRASQPAPPVEHPPPTRGPAAPSAPKGGVVYDKGRVAGWIGPAGSRPKNLQIDGPPGKAPAVPGDVSMPRPKP